MSDYTQDSEEGLRLVTCSLCNWVHMAVSLRYAFHEVRRFNEYFDELSAADQAELYGGKGASIDMYLYCSACGADCSFMRQYEDGDCPDGVTISPIVAHGDLLYDEADKHRAVVEAGFENDFLRKLVRRAFLILTQPVSVGLVPNVVARGRWIRDYLDFVDANEEKETVARGNTEGSSSEASAAEHNRNQAIE